MKTALFAAALLVGGAAFAQETDSRGIPVVSDPATPPAGANQPVPTGAGVRVVPAPNQQEVFQPRPAAEEYPPCTRERTDRCVQAYEPRLRARPRG